MYKKILLGLCLLAVGSFAFSQPTTRIKLTQLEQGKVGSSGAPGLIGLTNSAGDQRYVTYVKVSATCYTGTPATTGNLTNLSQFVIKCGSDSIWYIDWQGRSIFLGTQTGGGGAAVADDDWYKQSSNVPPNNIEIGWRKGVTIVGNKGNQTANNGYIPLFQVNDSITTNREVKCLIIGGRDAYYSAKNSLNGSYVQLGISGQQSFLNFKTGENFTIAANSGNAERPSTGTSHLTVSDLENTIRLWKYPSSRVDTEAINNILYTDPFGIVRSKPTTALPTVTINGGTGISAQRTGNTIKVTNIGTKSVQTAHVVIITGQSNAQGAGQRALVPRNTTDADPLVKIFRYGSVQNFQTLNIDSYNNYARDTGQFGPEWGLANAAKVWWPGETVYIIKRAQGGTDASFHVPGGAVYDSLWSNVQTALNILTTQAIKCDVSFWYLQGEQDAFGPGSTNADSFPYRIDRIIRAWKGNLGEDLPMFFSGVSPTAGYTYATQINGAFRDKATKYKNCQYFPTTNFPKVDGDHYDYAGQDSLAANFFRCILRNGGMGTTVSFPLPIVRYAPSSTSGSVTSVGLSLPGSVFNVSGTPVTGTGTLTGTFATQTANKFFASLTSGTGTPTFRQMADADLSASTTAVLGTTVFKKVLVGLNGSGAQTFTNFHYDGVTTRLGIGTASPGATLEVSGTASDGSVNFISRNLAGTNSIRAVNDGTVTIGTGSLTGGKLNVLGTANSIGLNVDAGTLTTYQTILNMSATVGSTVGGVNAMQSFVDCPNGFTGAFFKNTSNTANSRTLFDLRVGGPLAGNAKFSLVSDGEDNWDLELQNQANNDFTITNGSTSLQTMRTKPTGETLFSMAAATINSKAALQIVSTTKGFLPPTMTNTQRLAITSPPSGLTIVNSTTGGLNYYSGERWIMLSSSLAPTLTINSNAGTGATVTLSGTGDNDLTFTAALTTTGTAFTQGNMFAVVFATPFDAAVKVSVTNNGAQDGNFYATGISATGFTVVGRSDVTSGNKTYTITCKISQ